MTDIAGNSRIMQHRIPYFRFICAVNTRVNVDRSALEGASKLHMLHLDLGFTTKLIAIDSSFCQVVFHLYLSGHCPQKKSQKPNAVGAGPKNLGVPPLPLSHFILPFHFPSF